MNKQIIIKILKQESLTQQEALEFIVEYVKIYKDREVSQEELFAIFQMIQIGQFNIQFAAKLAAIKENITVYEIYDKNGQFIRRFVYE